MKRRKVILIPTLVVFRGGPMLNARRWAFDPWEYEEADPKVMGTLFDLMRLPLKLGEAETKAIREAKPWSPSPIAMANLRRLIAAGIPVAAGTDAGNPGTFHGASFATELKLMAQAGLTSGQILVCATLNGARLLGHEQELGSVEPGKRADLLVLDADPLKDILNTRKLLLVVKDGRPYRTSEILQDTPEDIVQRQVNAYNARDVEAFAATYAPDVTIRTLPETAITVSGRKALAERYGEAFRQRPDVGVAITSRAVDGPFVIDQETFVHRWDPARSRFAGTAIYEVKDGLIRTVWFLKVPSPETPPAP
jgi:hypothetical protein